VNADGSGFRFVKNTGLKSEAFGAPEWARDGNQFFVTISTLFTRSIWTETF